MADLELTATTSPTLAPLRRSLELLVTQLELDPPALRDDLTWRTHTSYHGVVHDAFERPAGLPVHDYERREHVGDIVVGYYVTRLIDLRLPALVVGQRSQLRSLLVSNATLSHLTRHFHWHHRLLASEAQRPHLVDNYKVQAALFEAYVGTLDLEQPRELVAAFLGGVFAPLAQAAYEGLRELYASPIPPTGQGMDPDDSGEMSTELVRRAVGGGGGGGPIGAAPSCTINYVGKIMEWASERGRAHHRSVSFRKLEPDDEALATAARGGPQVPSSQYELEWRDLGGQGALVKGLKARGEGRTVKSAKAAAAHQACVQLGL